ncbi:hypothetical protein AOXY_G11923 [Acipenser oxyrinchus oxyrinchus]|uniref:MANSC domain-containing protein n=1 Tax=Acipenser oxyrinchus oxyrinchus TaxID=40147 RepID=A0AAD8G6K5_ACIOX|nr:hypothetical protein AOXY_G11923 [Acipenser oxyrinchus oxyrinchus]
MPVWVLCVLFLLFESPTPSTSQLCSTEKIENMIIDIESALQYGVRGTEPIYSSMEDHCINLCCAEEHIEGQKTCNFVIFDKTKTVGHPNCYMFNCPLSAGACPMKPSEGMNSYKLIQDFPPGAQDSKKNVTTELSQVINVIDMHLDTDKRNQAEQENVKRENIPGPGGDDGHLGGVGPGEDDGSLGGVGPEGTMDL